MKSKKFVLAGLALLAITMVLLPLSGCKNDSVPEPTRYTVKFDKGDNSEYTGDLPADITVESGTKLTAEQLKGLADTADYIFEYWYDKDDDAQKPVEEGYTATKDVTLVAKWRDRGTVASVTFTPPTDTKFYLDESIEVSLTSEDGATIQYKLDDGEWMDYTEETPISVTTSTTITAKATKEGLKPSTETTATYTVRKLEGITVVTPPERTVYSVGQSFAPTGMVVTATYDDGEERTVTGTITTDTSTLTQSAGIGKTVTVSYKEGETTKTTTFTVTVFPKEVKVLTGYTSPNHTGSEWTYVAFGEWPQTIKADGVTVGESEEMGMFTYYLGDDSNYYVKHSDKYYKVEPIVWRVLTTSYKAPEGGTVGEILLLAEKILTGGVPYYDVYNVNRTVGEATIYPNNYEHSAVRAWLNGLKYEYKEDYFGKGFLQTAFTADAQSLIADTSVDNSVTSTFGTGQSTQENPYAYGKTKDKIFLLSQQEATESEYGFGAYSDSGEGNTRIRVTTDYAKATGASQGNPSAGYGGWWWLRSPNYRYDYYARGINDYGYANNSIDVGNTNGGVVPALSISLGGN